MVCGGGGGGVVAQYEVYLKYTKKYKNKEQGTKRYTSPIDFVSHHLSLLFLYLPFSRGW